MENYNPWWRHEEDEWYQEWNSKKIKWIPAVISQIPLDSFALHFLTGPRQVGKTTALKILIQNNIKNGRDPRSLFYFSCDMLVDFNELGEVLDEYLSMRKIWGISASLILLDEITFVKEWWRAIKARIDAGAFKHDVLILTGSAGIELLKEKERFPGRRGAGMDFTLLPLGFHDYLQLFKVQLESYSLDKLVDLASFINPTKIWATQIRETFFHYLQTGGFPRAIEDYLSLGKIRQQTMHAYLDWMRGDFARLGLNEKSMKEILSYLLLSRASPISWLSISKNTSINAPNTVEKYLEFLEQLHVIKILYLIAPDSRVTYRRNKKVHFTDPFLYRVLGEYTQSIPYEETIVEGTVAAHLSRQYPTYYWKDGSEVDAVILLNGEQVGFEVKWGIQSWRKPAHLKKAYLLDRSQLPLFLAIGNW